ncbi:hypothetical protein [Micromonospora parathelypteridis]|uniref:Uncharacterized protein n=1 Tax=Micromonospora parathelypteridis TaxID=1839617 RepID=A0A840WB07_9ACTN|nr:hypothetical protein [Micromonospora parathelypteridis]MBB5480171.1 hypothetical protein [Micromonospora parathelypteridis]GGO24615.1 hypothetical protein GCM10011576_46370 [Micromonospora parathelypteridis]
MVVHWEQKTTVVGGSTPTGVSVAFGWVVMIGAALLAGALFSSAELPARTLVMCLAAGGYAAVVADLRAVIAVTGLGMATFVGFLAHRFGDLNAGGDAWSYAMVIAFAATLGAGYRWLRSVAANAD